MAHYLLDIENLQILLPYKRIFIEKTSITEELSSGVDINFLCLLSIISCQQKADKLLMYILLLDSEIGRYFGQYANNHAAIKNECEKHILSSTSTRLKAWKYGLRNFKKDKAISIEETQKKLLRTLLLINEISEEGNTEIIFTSAGIDNYRDNYFQQVLRSVKIFIENQEMQPFIEKFEQVIDAPLQEYLSVILGSIFMYDQPLVTGYRPKKLSDFSIRVEEKHQKIFDQISLTPEAASCMLSENDTKNLKDIVIFRSKPFINIHENKYIISDGKLVEDLLFNNLFYKIEEQNNKDNFGGAFGKSFEGYVGFLADEAIRLNKKLSLIQEFTYKHKKNNNKSPDIIIVDSSIDTAMIIEVKSSRYLDAIISNENPDSELLHKSLEKLEKRPWTQSVKSIEQIVEGNHHPLIKKTTSFMYISVTMNSIPLSPIKIIPNNKDGEDISRGFYSMSIEGFELLMQIVAEDHDCNIFDLLLRYQKDKYRMSIKTYLHRYIKSKEIPNIHFSKMCKDNAIKLLSLNFNCY